MVSVAEVPLNQPEAMRPDEPGSWRARVGGRRRPDAGAGRAAGGDLGVGREVRGQARNVVSITAIRLFPVALGGRVGPQERGRGRAGEHGHGRRAADIAIGGPDRIAAGLRAGRRIHSRCGDAPSRTAAVD